MELETWLQSLDEAACFWHHTIALGKGMNPSFSLHVSQIGLFSPFWVEGKLWIDTNLKIDLVSHSAVAEGLGKYVLGGV